MLSQKLKHESNTRSNILTKSSPEQSSNDEETNYPSSSTVIFPYPNGPYPQQAEFMDCIFKSLQLIENDYQAPCGKQNEDDHSRLIRQRKKRRRNVIMLESPTGTGKSLSLACSAITWLRFREGLDLKLETNTIAKKDRIDPVTSPPTLVEDWLDAWTPSQGKAENLIAKRVEECRDRAMSSRFALEEKLNPIRNCLKRFGDDENDVRTRRTVRKNLVRNGVNAGRMAERMRRKRKYDRLTKSAPPYKKRLTFTLEDGGERAPDADYKSLDFCVDEYKSDDENALRIEKNSTLSSSDEEDNEKNAEHINPAAAKADSMYGMEGGVKSLISARELLDGGRLDGSGICREKANRLRYGNSLIQFSGKSSSSSLHNTVGGVTPGAGVRKIVYAARTHSQLSQFVAEVRRTGTGNKVRVVALGGRKLLCGNKDVLGSNRTRSEAVITEKCLDLQKGTFFSTCESNNKSDPSGMQQQEKHSESHNAQRKLRKLETKKNCCPLLSSKEAISTLALHMVAVPSDIEDLVHLGEASTTCAYYASREALAAAEVVVVPYNTLLSTQSRQAVGLCLKRSLVIIDEAHNIPEALRSVSSCRLTLPVIQAASSQITNYIKRYATRLKGKNIFYLGQIRRFLLETAKFLTKSSVKCSGDVLFSKPSMVVTATELLLTLKLDNLNIFSVLRFLQRSNLSQKLHGFNSSILTMQNPSDECAREDREHHQFISKHISSMSIVQEFLSLLTGSQREGRVVIEWPKVGITTNDGVQCERATNEAQHPSFRYLLLNPASRFQDILEDAHAVVLTGGTIRPFNHMAVELFGVNHDGDEDLVEQATEAEKKCSLESSGFSFTSISPSLTTFKCGHVIPPSHVFTTCLSDGPTGVKLDFRHRCRKTNEVCDELGRSIHGICGVVPAGLVVFLPSYSYEAYIMSRWKKTGQLQLMHKKKKIYREPKSPRDVENTLQSYSRDACASYGGGAILFCVIGGKMSEGINFANDMARCVFIVGLPYPNITNPELQEKMRLMDRQYQEKKISLSGQMYYDNLCMRAVNQSIGRAIRHAKDYAVIILADVRYSSESKIWLALPQWIRSDIEKPSCKSFRDNVFKIRAFFTALLNEK